MIFEKSSSDKLFQMIEGIRNYQELDVFYVTHALKGSKTTISLIYTECHCSELIYLGIDIQHNNDICRGLFNNEQTLLGCARISCFFLLIDAIATPINSLGK